jgi:formate-dependent nitrite reductase membrane component NrfD
VSGTASASAPRPAAAAQADGSVSYHGQPILKQTVWSWEIPAYFFAGGLSGSAATLAYLAELRGQEQLGRRAWLLASLAMNACPPLLISDLGRPERFLYMLRMFKVTSPMSVGSWILSVSGAATTAAAAHALTGRLRWLSMVARPVGAVSGLGLATYTAALVANTAVPAWNGARNTLPFVFGAGAAVSAAGAACAITPVDSARIARRLGVAAAVAELAATQTMEHGLGDLGQPYHEGRARRYGWLSRACLAGGAGLLARWGSRRRTAAVTGGALLCAGALSTRWSVYEAGKQSVADPRYVVEPQRRRADARDVPA